MSSAALFKRIRRIQIQTTRDVDDLFAGIYRSSFKGQGLEFEEVRAYLPGDDIRYIDWNVTARHQEPYVKSFREERELTVMLAVDISASTRYSHTDKMKSELIAEIGALLAFSAIKNLDKVGLLLFSSEIELFVAPKKGTRHVLRIIRELLEFQPKHKGTNVTKALSFLGKLRRRSICFLLSDFLSQENCAHEIKLLAQKDDLIAIELADQYESHFPAMGIVNLKDAETGAVHTVDATSELHLHADAVRQKWKEQFIFAGASTIAIDTERSYVAALRKFFKTRRKGSNM